MNEIPRRTGPGSTRPPSALNRNGRKAPSRGSSTSWPRWTNRGGRCCWKSCCGSNANCSSGRAEPDAEEYRRRFPDSVAVIDAVFGPEPARSAATSPRPDPTATGPITPDGDTDGDQPRPPAPACGYFGDYELIRELGRGGMGIVYKARQISLNRPVALKMIRSAALASRRRAAAVPERGRGGRQLDHPHIVPIYEVGDHDGQRYFSMKLIGGTSLDKKLADYIADPKSAARLVKRPPRRCTTPTSGASSTATSSRPTSCSTSTASRT